MHRLPGLYITVRPFYILSISQFAFANYEFLFLMQLGLLRCFAALAILRSFGFSQFAFTNCYILFMMQLGLLRCFAALAILRSFGFSQFAFANFSILMILRAGNTHAFLHKCKACVFRHCCIISRRTMRCRLPWCLLPLLYRRRSGAPDSVHLPLYLPGYSW